MQKSRVTIGVCVKNSENSIADAIDSIHDQDFPHELMEIIFVDDGSEDKTLSIINSRVQSMGLKFRIFHHQWKGLGYSRNLVVSSANGEYIIWVDGDMSLPQDFVRKQVKYMDGNPDVGIGKGRYGMRHITGLVAYLENLDALVKLLYDRQTTSSEPLGTGGCIYRVEAIREAGGFDENITGVGEDMDAEYRILASGWLLQVTNAEFYERRRNTWKELWTEYFWHGSGGRKILMKVSPRSMLLRIFPPTVFLTVISRSCSAYKLTHKKIVFVLPLQWIFKRMAWFLGFTMSARKCYV